MRKTAWLIGALVASLISPLTALALSIQPLSLEDLAQRADKIFVGKCIRAEQRVTAQGTPVLEVTFAVSTGLKGTVGRTVTFRQFSSAPQPATNPHVHSLWSAVSAARVPRYVPGEEALLFLAAEGPLGLSAPVGGFQGKFSLTTAADGTRRVTNSALKHTQAPNLALPAPGQTTSYDRLIKVLGTMVKPAQ